MKKIYFPAVLLLLLLAVVGCGMFAEAIPTDGEGGEDEDYLSPNSEPETSGVETITLFFADSQAQYVRPEQREVVLGNHSQVEVVMRELLKGPQDPYLRRGIPEGIEIREIKSDPDAGMVTVDFDANIIELWPQGSSGEMMFLNSLVFTLTEVKGIDKVVIKVEGEIPEVLGQIDVKEPLSKGLIRTQPVFVDQDRCGWLQQEVDQGRQTWRLDPLKVAKFEGKMAGFLEEDVFTLISGPSIGEHSGTVEAEVAVVHEGKKYIIKLIQPVENGEKGIWDINSIKEQ